MVTQKVVLQHEESQYHFDYDTEDGLDVLRLQIFSLTLVPPDEQKICGDGGKPIRDNHDLDQILSSFQLLMLNAEDPQSCIPSSGFEKSDEELARMLQVEEEALFYQEFQANDHKEEFEQRIRPYVNQVLLYEDTIRQQAARESAPFDELEEKALILLAKEGRFEPSKHERDHAFLLQLLFWFKQSFRWVNSPSCDGCGGETSNIGMGEPLPSEIKFGASRVEVYRCHSCSRLTRFPRYNDPLKLIETRRGRCGEWANCFTLYCRAFGYPSRLILEFTDHVWTECFSHFLGRWMHLDPCEGRYDCPLLYEKGWGKNLNYVIAVSRDGVYDVTKRYTRKWHEVLTRRNIIIETLASSVLSSITKDCRASFSSQEISVLEDLDAKEAVELGWILNQPENSSVSLPGRQSGSVQWRMKRCEMGSNSLGFSSCPVRVCVDDHVRAIYDAFSNILSELVQLSLTKGEAVALLEKLKRLFENLIKSPFKHRRGSLNISSVSKIPMDQLRPVLDKLFAAFNLKSDMDTEGIISVSLVREPIMTSLSLPVGFAAASNSLEFLKYCDSFCKEILYRPLLKLNRVSAGSVIASGEEHPHGIVGFFLV